MCKREKDEGYSNNENLNEHMYSLNNVLDRGPSDSQRDTCNKQLAMGDGPCQRMIKYMVEFVGEVPDDWAGYRQAELNKESFISVSDQQSQE